MALRRQWGCDREIAPQEHDARVQAADASALVFGRCYRCSGKDDRCPVCHGRNEWRLLRCPNAVVESWHRDVCTMIGYQALGVLPYSGGWCEQPAVLVHAMRVVLAEKAAIDEARRQRDRDRTRGGS